MPRKVTVTFADGTQHVYDNAPDDITPEAVTARAEQEFGLAVTSLDGGRKAVTSAPAQQEALAAVEAPEVSAVQPAEPLGAIEANRTFGVQETFTNSKRNRPEVNALADSLWQQGVRDPAVFNQKINEAFPGVGISFTNETIASAKQLEAYRTARGEQNASIFAPYVEDTGIKDPERPEGVIDTLGNAFARSSGQIVNSGIGLAALGADIVGADETADSLLESYILNNAKFEYNLPRPVDTYKDVDSFGDAGLYAIDTIGEMIPQMAGSLGGGVLGQQAAKRVVAKSVDDLVETQIASGATREAAEAFAKQTVDKIASRGGLAGAFVPSAGQETGNTFANTYMQTGEKAPAMSIAAGLTSGSLDALLPAAILRQLNISPQAITGKLRTELLKQGSKGFVMEGGTEALQEFITQLPTSVIKGESPFTADMLDRMTEAFIRGGIGGSAASSVTATVNAVRVGRAGDPSTFTGESKITAPTGAKNTKVYREGLAAAQDAILDRAKTVAGGWTNRPEIQILPNFKKEKGIDDDALGVYREDGTVMINTEAVLARAKRLDLAPETVVDSVIFHEALGHHGMTQRWGEELDNVLAVIYDNGTEQLQSLVDKWIEKNPSAYKGPNQRVRATEEVLAEWSEKNGVLPKTLWDTVLNKIKNFARDNLGMNLKISEREVKAYLAVAQRRVTEGESTNNVPGVAKNVIEDRKYLPVGVVAANENVEGGVTFDKRGKPVLPSRVMGPEEAYKYYSAMADWNESRALGFVGTSGYDRYKKDAESNRQKADTHLKRAFSAKFGKQSASVRPTVAQFKASLEAPTVAEPFNDKYMAGDTTSAGFRRPKVDDRMRMEDRKLRRKNAYDPFAPPSRNPDGTPYVAPEDKYMRPGETIDPDELTADDLIEAKNALELLDRLDYTPTVINPDQLEAEALARNLPPSDITRLVGMEPGKLMKRLFLYDVAATKLSDRAAKIKGDIEENGLTPDKQLAYFEATQTLSELTQRIFDFQAEIGRTLAATRRVNYSRKRVRDLKEVLKEYGAESLMDPETFYRYMAEVEGKLKAKTPGTPTFKDKLISFVNIPRAIMSSADLSAPLRQGVVFVGHREYWGSFLKMFSMITPSGETNYKFLMEKIAKHPNYELMQKARVAFSSLDGELSSREEDFQTEIARKIPVYGKIVKASEQAYAGFLNKLRADMFNKFVDGYQKAGIEVDDEILRGLGEFINAGTGRAELPKWLRPSSTVINATFFSGRLMYSRVQMLNPAFYAQLPAPVRKQALTSMLSFGAIALLVNGALNALWPEEVETEIDPRSSDFLKIKVGDTRFDIGGGFNQYLILGARTNTWLYNNVLGFGDRIIDDYTTMDSSLTDYQVANKKTVAGKYKKYGNDEFGQDTYAGAIGDFFRSKLSPQASYVLDAMVGTDYIGREFTVEGSLASRLVPMTASGVYEAYAQASPVPLPVVFTTSLFGAGVNTYGSANTDPDEELKAPVSFEMKDLEDGENKFIRAEKGVVTLKKQTRDKWEATINNYYPVFIEQITREMGYKTFDEMSDEMKEAVIKEAKKDARYNAKEDMMYELGLVE